jgi:hypothetical protein
MKYQLIIKIPMEQIDDLAARQAAKELVDDFELPVESVVKLQKLFDNKEPIGVKI